MFKPFKHPAKRCTYVAIISYTVFLEGDQCLLVQTSLLGNKTKPKLNFGTDGCYRKFWGRV